MKLIPRKMVRHGIKLGDLFHTINGGVIEPFVEVAKYEREAFITVAAPTVAPGEFKVVLLQNKLTVLLEKHDEDNPTIWIPLFSRTFDLPPLVDLTGIEATVAEDELRIRLPYHDAAKQPKLIEIRQI